MTDAATVPAMIESAERTHGGAAPMINGFTLTDSGNGKRFAAEYGEVVKFISDWGEKRGWTYYDRGRWRIDNHGQVMRYAKLRAERIKDERIAGIKEEAIAAHCYASLDDTPLQKMLRQAASEPEIARVPDDFDQSPMLLNLRNCTIDLETGKAREHSAADMLTKQAPVEYDPAAESSAWLSLLDRWTGGDEETIAALQTMVGYSLTGVTTEKALFVLYGPADTGKTTFIETIAALMGDYAQATPIETLLAERHGGSIPNDIAALRSARLVTAGEADQNATFSASKIKRLVGSDTVAARFMRGEFFNFKPQFKIMIGTNHRPRVKDSSGAFFNKVKMIPFTLPILNPVKGLREELIPEFPGILNWAIAGCLRWQKDGLIESKAIRAATEEYKALQDALGQWIEECTYRAPGFAIEKSIVYQNYLDWCDSQGDKWPIRPQKDFSALLSQRGWEDGKIKSGTVRVWRNVGLRAASAASGTGKPNDGSAARPDAILGETESD